ncbi:MAG: hypothetical protein ACRD1X_05585 [Vicinamibacteria bacterium]
MDNKHEVTPLAPPRPWWSHIRLMAMDKARDIGRGKTPSTADAALSLTHILALCDELDTYRSDLETARTMESDMWRQRDELSRDVTELKKKLETLMSPTRPKQRRRKTR